MAIDKTPLTRKQKLHRWGVSATVMAIADPKFPATWMEKQVNPMVTRFLKKWSGLGKSANMAILHLPRSLGGLNLPAPSTLHKKFQVSRQCQLFTFQDSFVRFLVNRGLQH